MMVEEKKRLRYLDYMRGVGILLVVMHHVFRYFPVFNAVVSYIILFHVGIFFVISGYISGLRTEKKRDFKQFFFHRAKQLLIPYAFFSVYNSVSKLFVLSIQGNLTHEIIREELTEFFITGNGTVWYLMTLFLVEMSFELLGEWKVVGNKDILYLISGLILAISFYFIRGGPFPFVVIAKRCRLGYVFFVYGYFLGRYLLNKTKWNHVLGVLFILTGSLIWRKNGGMISYMDGAIYGTFFVIIAAFLIITGILLIMQWADQKIVKTIWLLDYFGKNSLIVLLVHPSWMLCYVYLLGSNLQGHDAESELVKGLIFLFFLIIIEIPCVEIINKYFPFLIGKRKHE